MAETRREEKTRRLVRLVAGRLAQNGWTLGAAALAILAVHAFGGGSPLFSAMAIMAVVATAALAPRRNNLRQRQSERAARSEAGGLNGLSAQTLAAAVRDPLIVFDANGSAIHANSAAQSAFGVIGPGMPLLLKFRAPEMQKAIEAVRSAGGSLIVDYVERVPVERVYRVSVAAVGQGTGLFIMIFKDQSETRRIERMRADFVANASHQLRTPLASISGFVETLRGPARNDAAARDDFLQIMQDQTARMARLIDDLLSLSRLEMKPYLPPDAPIDVRAIVQSVIDSLAPLARESGVEIEKHLGDETFEARGDRDELFQVFENLLENACKYGQSGGRVTVSIERSNAPPGPEIAVTVRDFGPGIAEEHIPRVTERFYRIDDGASRAHKGTGLGLAIVKHIVTRHNARLSIKSEPGKGAAFTVHLPVG